MEGIQDRHNQLLAQVEELQRQLEQGAAPAPEPNPRQDLQVAPPPQHVNRVSVWLRHFG